MTPRTAVVCLLPFMLAGCASQEEQIIDLAGVVFTLFVLIVVAQLFAGTIMTTSLYKRLDAWFAPIRLILPPLAYASGCGIFIYGALAGGLQLIAMFLGIIVFLFGWFLKQYHNLHMDLVRRARYAKLMMLCITFGLSLLFLMTAAGDLLRI